MSNIKLSVIIPYFQCDSGKPAVLKRLTDSLKGVDEIIISANQGEGYSIPINRGLMIAHGDFMLVLNDDLVMNRGTDLRSICDPNFVTSPSIDENQQPFWGCAFCIPKWVYAKVGGLWEGYEVSYFDDDDYIQMLKKAGIPMKCVPTVNFENVDGGGRTLHTFPNHAEFFERNKQTFIKRWGNTPENL